MKTSRLAVTANPCGSPHDRVFAYPPHAGIRHFVPRRAAARILTIVMGICAMGASLNASSVKLAWNANPESDIAGYRLSYGTSPGVHSITQNTGNVTTTTVDGLSEAQTYYFVVRAVNTSGLVSDPSDEISYQVPASNLVVRSGWRLHFVDSQESPTYAATHAFDGNPNSFWHTAYRNGSTPPPHEIQIDLGQTEVIAGFRYLPRQDAHNVGNIADYEFHVSMDGSSWGNPVATGTFSNTKSEKEVRFPSVQARYIMLRQLSEVNGGNHCSVAEINLVRGDEDGAGQPENRQPEAFPSSLATNQDVPAAVTLVAEDPDGDPLTYQIVSQPGKGTLGGTAPDLIYTPHAGATGADSFTFRASDGQLTSNTATVSITIMVVDPAPTLISRAGWRLHYVNSHEPPTYAATNAFDGKTGTFWHTAYINGTTPPPHEIQIDLGQTEVIAGFRYLPRQDAHNVGNIADYEFHVSMDGSNWGSPVAAGTFPNTRSEKEVGFSSVNARFIRLRQLSEVNGMDDCAVAEINLIAGDPAQITLPENRAPVASSFTVTSDGATPVAVTLVAEDPDGDPLSYQIVSQPGKGTLGGTAPDLIYTPHAGASGSDSFTFRASDGQLTSNTATVSITITAPEPATTLVSRAGWSLHFVSSQEPPTYAATHAFDGNPNSFWHTAWINGTTPPPHEIQIDLGKPEVIAGFRYLPRQDAYHVGNIADYEFYVSTDGSNWGDPVAAGTFPDTKAEKEVRFPNVQARYIRLRQLTEVDGRDDCSVAEINLIVGDAANISLPENRAPVASSSSVSTDEDTPVAITLAASDPDGDPLTYQIVTHPAMGGLSGTAPNLTYTPHPDVNGSDSLSFRVSDGQLTSDIATVSITIHPVNDAPVAQDQSVTTAEDTPVGVMLYATDVDGDPLTYRIVTPPANGRLSGSAPNLIYTPKPQYHGSDSFTFVANDGTVDSSIATVSITVTSVNYPPVAIARMISTPADTPVSITLTATDRNGDELTYRITRPPMKGRLSGTPPTLTYTPNPRVSGSDSFTFVANDGIEDSNTATIFINLTEPQQKNRPPVFSEDKLSRSPGTSGEEYSCLSLEGSAIDPDGDIVAYEKADGPDWLVISHHGGIAGTPPAEAAGLNAFVIRARDPEGAYAEALLEIHIQDTDLPLPWTMDRIGVAGEESAAFGDHDSLTLTGSGAMASKSDSGLFVWQTLTGDGDITVRIDSILDAGPSARIGLMIRESLSSDSKHTFIGVDGRGFVRWVRRTRTGGNTSISSVASTNPVGVWLRLTRDGNTISAFTSRDGSDWTGVAKTSIDLGSSSYIGLMVASGGETPSTAVFDNVTVTP